jgi:arylsulfatase A
MACTMDLLPTIAKLAGTSAPGDRRIDGKDIWPLMSGEPSARTPHEAFYYFWDRGLEAVRAGQWKLHLSHNYRQLSVPGSQGKPGKYSEGKMPGALYDLHKDIGETNNVATQFPDVVARLEQLAETAREDLGDSLTKRTGKNVREPGRVR